MTEKMESVSVRALIYENDTLSELSAERLSSYSGDGFVWLHIESGDKECSKVPSYVPDLAKNALLATETRPRCEEVDNAALINLRGPGRELALDSDRLVSVRAWVEAKRVTSVSRRPFPAITKVEEAMRAGRLRDGGDFVSALSLAISTELDPQVASLGDRLDECEGEIVQSSIYELRRRITALRSEAIAMRRFVAPDRDALVSMTQLELPWISTDDRMQLREAADRFARMAEELEAVRERAALLHEQLTDLRAEIVDSRSLAIAVVAFIFLPLTFITGLLGMNVEGIPFAAQPWAFWGVVAFCLGISVFILGWFAFRRWLKD